MSPTPVPTLGSGAPSSGDTSGSVPSPAPPPGPAPGTETIKADRHVLVTPRVLAKLAEVRAVLQRDWGRARITNNEVIDYLLEQWERQ